MISLTLITIFRVPVDFSMLVISVFYMVNDTVTLYILK